MQVIHQGAQGKENKQNKGGVGLLTRKTNREKRISNDERSGNRSQLKASIAENDTNSPVPRRSQSSGRSPCIGAA
ncbi:hypothetical protein ACOMHN_058263 [Nucella lapillus]